MTRLGIARARVGPAAALIDSEKGLGACEENRLTRARHAQTTGPPELATAELLNYFERSASDIASIHVVADEDDSWWRPSRSAAGPAINQIDAHHAHAEYAVRASGFDEALAVVCDTSSTPGYSAFRVSSSVVKPLEPVGDFPIAKIYGQLTAALGFQAARDEHLVEAMARAGDRLQWDLRNAISMGPDGISVRDDAFMEGIASATADANAESRRLHVAAAVQHQLGEALIELLGRLARTSGLPRVCLSGGLFFNTHFTTVAANAAVFADTFVPPHPGRNGAAVGAALIGAGLAPPEVVSPYLGPGYSDPQVKEALENCKLAFDLQREDRVVDTVLHAISRGRLVGWFHGRLEFGPRALGHRTVLADPFSPHVLDNLNGYLKKRPGHRTYGVSVPRDRLGELFDADRPSPFMQYEYQPRDPDKFRSLLPAGVNTLRVHTVDHTSPRYLRLLEQWGQISGTPVLVNTSFNGFHEPLVCSPRDAIRVFYGTGLDLLALEDFILRK